MAQAAEAIHNFNNTGLSILEIGHRTPWFVEVLEEARQTVKELMQLGDDHEILFLHGGATTQFMQVPMNLLDVQATAAYCDNGIWGSKALNEARLFGNVQVAASSKANGYANLPKDLDVPAGAAYLHYTSNNTVEGTQWHSLPQTSAPLVADMSSDIFSYAADFKSHALIYAGAQKNMGAAGVNLLVVRKDMLGKVNRPLPSIMDYRKHIEAQSLMNTPPVFAVYVAMLTLRWIKASGGLAEMERRAKERADLLYHAIDSLTLFSTWVAHEDRSLMNAVFKIQDEALQNRFLEECKTHGMVGVKGYRTVGGLRVSMYNALPLQSVQALVDLMQDFSRRNG